MQNERYRINVGCGVSPLEGCINYDNSLSLRLASVPLFPAILFRLNLIRKTQYDFINFIRQSDIEIHWADVARHMPLPDNSVEVLYSCHMIEHLDREEANGFLRETYRVLSPGGILRIVTPDLRKLVREYEKDGDGNAFMQRTLLPFHKQRTFLQKLRFLITGFRDHCWLYDADSLSGLLHEHGFTHISVLAPGETSISEPRGIDLKERSSESLYIEAVK